MTRSATTFAVPITFVRSFPLSASSGLATLERVSNPADFIRWVTNPARTNDELFTVELLLERMRAWHHWPFRDRSLGFEETMKVMKARRFNPAYRPALPLDELEALQERAATVTHFNSHGTSDRPVRDLTALSFFPALENINITAVDIADLSPLASLPKVNWLTFMESPDLTQAARFDFAQLGDKPALDHLHLSLRQPWPDLAALATCPVAREVIYGGNLLAFAEVETLPGAIMVKAQKWFEATSLRDLRTFPTMPKVRRLDVAPTASLEGIDRYPTVLNLELGGDFADLTPLASMENVTYLKLTGERFEDLTPLTRMPKLRELVLARERPLDLSPLTDATQLRRVEFERCATMRTELSALNAGLLPEADDFLADAPRPLSPLRFQLIGNENEGAKNYLSRRYHELTDTRSAFYDGDAALERSEARSFLTQLFGELNRLLGLRWGIINIDHITKAGRTQLAFKRFQDTTRIREIIQLLRELSARSRFPWVFDIMVEPHGDMSYELEQLQELEAKAKTPEGHWLAEYYKPESVLRENEERERHSREKYEILEREHLYKLQQQQGDTIDSNLTPPPPADEDEEIDPDNDEDEEELLSQPVTGDDDEEGGGVALAPPPPAPPDTEELSDQLRYAVVLFEDCLLVSEGWADRARYGLGEAPVEWSES
jgi:hypothetical protein